MDAPPIEDAAHVFLHLNLCAAVARAAQTAPVPVRLRVTDRVGGIEFERTIRVARADGDAAVVEFVVHRGIFRLRALAPQSGCATDDYLDFLPDESRAIVETLAPAPPPAAARPVVLVDGTAPMAFVYVKPTFVFFPGTLTCNAPIGTPLPVENRVEYDQRAFHAWFYPGALAATALATPGPAPTPTASPGASPAASPVTIALRLRTATGLAHYVRVPIPFPPAWAGWPSHVQFNISEEMIDGLATEKTDALLCPKLWQTTTH